MQERDTRTDERNEALRKQFVHMTNIKHMRTQKVLEILADKFFLKVTTVEQIVYRIGNYKDKPKPKGGDQLSMF